MANSVDCGKWQFGKRTYNKGKIYIFKTVINADANAFDIELRDKTREEFGWKDMVVYGFIGRYVDQKNPLFLIDIFNKIAKKQSNAILVMIGFGELDVEIHQKIHNYGINDKVIDLGRRDDIHDMYKILDLFTLSSSFGEAFPLVVGEAMLTKVPCVVTDIGDASMLIGNTGRIIWPNSMEFTCAAEPR